MILRIQNGSVALGVMLACLLHMMDHKILTARENQISVAREEEDGRRTDDRNDSLTRQLADPVLKIPTQPLLSQSHRLSEALEAIGSPLPKHSLEKISHLKQLNSNIQNSAELNPPTPRSVVESIEAIFDPLCLATVTIPKTGSPTVIEGDAERVLLEQGWRTFLIKVINPHHRTGRLFVESPNARPLPHSHPDQVTSRWMQLSSFEGQPMRANLSGLGIEYRIIQIYSRDKGQKDAILEFSVSGDPKGDRHLIHEWRFANGTDGWHEMNQINITAKDGSLHIDSLGNDPFMGTTVTHRGGPMVLRFWGKAETDGIGQFFWWTKDIPQATGDRQTNFILEPNREHLYEVPFFCDGELAGVRIDPLVKPGKMRIDWIDLYSSQRNDNWAQLKLKFESRGATPVTFRIIDQEGLPAFAKFEIRDSEGRNYPAQSKRLAPDFFFQQHIYRGDGETISLPPGQYQVKVSRGPESLTETLPLQVGTEPTHITYQVRRWIDPSKSGWWSGDHHIHAAGCLHYDNPTQGVQPEDMIRHLMGEDLKVGCCLTWGPCFDFQKRFFTGDVDEQSSYPYTLRYDIEVSGFGSHMSGHLNLLNLKEQIYPGGESKDHWPTLGLNTLKWAKKQGAICGPAHSSIGLTQFVGRLEGTEGKDGPHNLPNYNLPAFDGIGANEFIVDITHEVPGPDGNLVPSVDFISTMNTERVAEWNMWYHVLNCGFRVAASGETDFPCMSGERVGIGRVYAKVDGRLTFDKWIQSIASGRSYVSDGLCHLLDFAARSDQSSKRVDVGTNGSEMQLTGPQRVTFSTDFAANLAADSTEIELIINGYPVAQRRVDADGSKTRIEFDHNITKSCWVAMRVFPNAHTNPIYITVEDEPILGPAESIRWCQAGVEQCWKSKQNMYAIDEQADARSAYEHARRVYADLLQRSQQRERPE
ncbi:MAG: CehA/McbA family metallohydrolase [Rubripirellula sp.]